MNFKDTSCCGIKEITSLGHEKTPFDAMLAFCASEVENGARFGGSKSKQIYSHFLFTAAVYDETCKNWETIERYRKNPEDYPTYQDYGTAFAKFIVDNGLGTVIETPAVFNKAFHADHKVKAWIWTVNDVAVVSWWEKNKAEKEIREARTQTAHLTKMIKGNKEVIRKQLAAGYNNNAYYEQQITNWEKELTKHQAVLTRVKEKV